MTDRQLELLLGDYPSPGPSPSADFHDAAGNVVAFPRERAHFASRVVAYDVGTPAPLPEGQDPKTALGPPDYEADKWSRPRAVRLGNGGSITLAFDEGALLDGDGPDLFIWEIGPSVEAMSVEISADGTTWIPVGVAPGGPCAVDIGQHQRDLTLCGHRCFRLGDRASAMRGGRAPVIHPPRRARRCLRYNSESPWADCRPRYRE